MTTKEKLLKQIHPNHKGLLTNEECAEFVKKGTIMVIENIITEQFFLTDQYTFGLDILNDQWLQIMCRFPLDVEPREGLRSGHIDTIEKFIFVFHNGCKQIKSIDELAELVDKQQ
jgi:hypothetical protein